LRRELIIETTMAIMEVIGQLIEWTWSAAVQCIKLAERRRIRPATDGRITR